MWPENLCIGGEISLDTSFHFQRLSKKIEKQNWQKNFDHLSFLPYNIYWDEIKLSDSATTFTQDTFQDKSKKQKMELENIIRRPFLLVLILICWY